MDGIYSTAPPAEERTEAEAAIDRPLPQGPLPYGDTPGAEEIKALVERGLSDGQIAALYRRSRSWAKWLRGRYGIPGQSFGAGARRRVETAARRWLPPAPALATPVVPRPPSRPPSLDGLDEECRRWVANGGRITRLEPKPYPDAPLPVRPRSRAG
jgi:hypothetical protein